MEITFNYYDDVISSSATYIHTLHQLQDTEITNAITMTMNNVSSILVTKMQEAYTGVITTLGTSFFC